MNKYLFVSILFLVTLSCNKEKRSRKDLNGDWEISHYSEIIFDGTTEMFDLNSGSASFSTSKKNKTGTVKINWNATNDEDTSNFDFTGDFEQVSFTEWSFDAPNKHYDCKLNRQLKKDLIIEMVINPNRKSVLVLKKN